MVSIEADREIYKRQKFNLPFRTLKLIEGDLSSFISHYDPGNDRSVYMVGLYGTGIYATFRISQRCQKQSYQTV